MKQRIIGSYNKLKETNIISNFFNLSSIQISNILLLILIIPVITRAVGIVEFGIIMFATRFSQFAGAIVNYGTGQSGVRDVAFHINDSKKLSHVFFSTLLIRTIIFVCFLAVMFALQWFHIRYYPYLLLSIPIVLAEVFNPLCFFIGAEKLRIFNILNLVSNIASVLGILVFIKSPADAGWVNLILGTSSVIAYFGLLIHLLSKLKVDFYLPSKTELLKIGKDNFYLTVNNLSVNLQQSIIIFALPIWGLERLLGPYSLCDRIIGQCRNLLITISNALYPNAAHLYKQSITSWNVYRKKTKYLLAGVFFTGSLLIFFLADFIVFTLSKEHNTTAVLFLKIMALVPTISALNVLNVLDQLLKNHTVYIFRIAIILFIVTLLTTFVLVTIGSDPLIGSFTLIVEACALLMYEYIVNKTSVKNG
ncbi:oligosaccharide flippase family protein [Mucilaginibacter xinganensis]|uniref:Polisoprenol-linked O-antigen transporter, putative n=1 Tax=Mucilaginibacter xinganensis TaxID=1234841 RepID=A0A223NVV1_9SPHI|nr:oligosaccharide flippase family protein [Mucilaginibacter xinganensis]ASU33671.1 polisoprenol-linked O-antigen transporter, putative [Mucilaginibacter xinganensis]